MIHAASVQPDILFAWCGFSLVITNARGECGPEYPLTGYFFRETRFLSHLQLEVNGHAPWLCDTATIDPRTLAFTFIHPEQGHYGIGAGPTTQKRGDKDDTLPERALDIRLTHRVTPRDLAVTGHVSNRSAGPLDVSLAWRIGADFIGNIEAFQADFQVQADVETRTGDRSVVYRYSHPHLPFESAIHVGRARRLACGG